MGSIRRRSVACWIAAAAAGLVVVAPAGAREVVRLQNAEPYALAFTGDGVAIATAPPRGARALAFISAGGGVQVLSPYTPLARASGALQLEGTPDLLAVAHGGYGDSGNGGFSRPDGSGFAYLHPLCPSGVSGYFDVDDANVAFESASCAPPGIVVMQQPTGARTLVPQPRCYGGNIRLAGSFVSFEEGCSVAEKQLVVHDWRAGGELYRVPATPTAGIATYYDLQADGKLAQVKPDNSAISWYSPSEPFAHDIPDTSGARTISDFARDRIAFGTRTVSISGGDAADAVPGAQHRVATDLDLETGRAAYAQRACIGSRIVVDTLGSVQPKPGPCRFRVRWKRRGALGPRREVVLGTITCPDGCQGYVRLHTRAGSATRDFRVGIGRRAALRFRASRSMERDIRRRRSVRASAQIRLFDPSGGNPPVRTVRVSG